MTTLFKSHKSKNEIIFYKIRIVLIPSLIVILLLGISSSSFNLAFWLRVVPIILFTWVLILSLKVFYTFRYYIIEIQMTENEVEIIYYKYGRKMTILLNKEEIYFRLNDFRRESKYFEILNKDLLIIKQAPYLEWKENTHIKKRLEDNGFKFRTYW